jgi:hypothetical protein
VLSVGMFSFPLPRSLSRYAPAVRLRRAAEHAYKLEKTERSREERRRPLAAVFHRLRPLTSITELTLKSVVAKPDRTIKIPGVSPDGSLVRSPVPAIRFTGVIPLLWPRLSHSTPDTQFRVGSSLQAGLYARTPVQSDCAFPVTIILSPTRKDTTNRHWQPLVTDLEEYRVLEVMP